MRKHPIVLFTPFIAFVLFATVALWSISAQERGESGKGADLTDYAHKIDCLEKGITARLEKEVQNANELHDHIHSVIGFSSQSHDEYRLAQVHEYLSWSLAELAMWRSRFATSSQEHAESRANVHEFLVQSFEYSTIVVKISKQLYDAKMISLKDYLDHRFRRTKIRVIQYEWDSRIIGANPVSKTAEREVESDFHKEISDIEKLLDTLKNNKPQFHKHDPHDIFQTDLINFYLQCTRVDLAQWKFSSLFVFWGAVFWCR